MIKSIDKLIRKLQKSEKGQGMVEYALIIAFVAAIAIAALQAGLKDAIVGAFSDAQQNVQDARDKNSNIKGGNSGSSESGSSESGSSESGGSTPG